MAVRIANRLLRYGRSDITGVTYTRDELAKMVIAWEGNDNPVFGTFPDPSVPLSYTDISKIATKVTNMWLDDEGLVVEQEVLDTPDGRLFQMLIDESVDENKLVEEGLMFTLSANVVGTLDNGYNATELKFKGVFIRGPNNPAIPG